jgi:hypothetical protein
MKNILFTLTFIILSSTAIAGDLKPFTSDGCSAFPDGTVKQKNLWLQCCTEHDKAYWAGGTSDMRAKADENLRKCVTKVGEPGIAKLMLAGVRVGGTPYLPTTFRWGYGWSFPRGYKQLTAEEQAMIDKELSDPSKSSME